jgi:hypothetical protein
MDKELNMMLKLLRCKHHYIKNEEDNYECNICERQFTKESILEEIKRNPYIKYIKVVDVDIYIKVHNRSV